MRLFLLSRRVGWATLVILVFESSLVWWGSPALVVRHSEAYYAVPLAVLTQFFVGFVVASTTSSEFRRTEMLASRPMWSIRVGSMVIVFAALAAVTFFASVLLGPAGTLDTFAPLRAALGLSSVGVIASLFVNRLLAGIVPTAVGMFPVVFDPLRAPGGIAIGFTVDEPARGWWTVGISVVLALVASSVTGRSRWQSHF